MIDYKNNYYITENLRNFEKEEFRENLAEFLQSKETLRKPRRFPKG